jgi:hypothetical protein
MKVEGFGFVVHGSCVLQQGFCFAPGGPMQGVHLRGSEVISECYKVGYSATLARAHVHNFICSGNRGLPSLGDLSSECI